MLGITAAKSILPYFEDEHGEPDTLPSQFVDPKTNYCQPYPHWKVPLTNQVLWIPMFLLWFRSTIPNDQSERSALLRSLTDEQIVALLHDGPFRSAQTMWRNMKKTDEELEAMRASARKYRRTERVRANKYSISWCLTCLPTIRKLPHVPNTSSSFPHSKVQNGNTCLILDICRRMRVMMMGR